MLTTVLYGVGNMISHSADRRFRERSSGQPTGGNHVTDSLTRSLTGLFCGIALLVAGGVAQAQDPEPVVEPEPVIEADRGEPAVEPVIEPESPRSSSESSSRATPVVDPPSRVARLAAPNIAAQYVSAACCKNSHSNPRRNPLELQTQQVVTLSSAREQLAAWGLTTKLSGPATDQ